MAEREEITRSGGGEGGGSAASAFLNRMLDPFRRFRQFLHESRIELKQVSWPSLDDVKSTTVVVVITIFVFGAFLFIVDRAVGFVVQHVLTSFK